VQPEAAILAKGRVEDLSLRRATKKSFSKKPRGNQCRRKITQGGRLSRFAPKGKIAPSKTGPKRLKAVLSAEDLTRGRQLREKKKILRRKNKRLTGHQAVCPEVPRPLCCGNKERNLRRSGEGEGVKQVEDQQESTHQTYSD